jgi:hypothetical protein
MKVSGEMTSPPRRAQPHQGLGPDRPAAAELDQGLVHGLQTPGAQGVWQVPQGGEVVLDLLIHRPVVEGHPIAAGGLHLVHLRSARWARTTHRHPARLGWRRPLVRRLGWSRSRPVQVPVPSHSPLAIQHQGFMARRGGICPLPPLLRPSPD